MSKPLKFPRFIAICGNPKSGKSLAQEILSTDLNYLPIDDGHVLREFAVNKLGLSWDDVQTQEGKKRVTSILGKDWEHRILLGEFGNRLEEMFGEHIMPFIATRNLYPNARYSFGSVRKTQGHFFKEHGGVVIEIMNPMAPPSGNAFDKYDLSAVDRTIINDGMLKFDDPQRARAYFRGELLSAIDALAKERS
ncbi:hypothetical protein [Shinella zoogloeoides]|uniref:hypothetical protein n=1 Tax=Shinella zoogloeoides TaxID=352475 RepID=UPI00273F3C7A|nr:hypothetical protein [Shinella zoogloeoides]WLR90977.1 hypothetical protein Q9316_00075 [Shinella zoogloeoides]